MNIPKDKQQHALGGVVVAIGALLVAAAAVTAGVWAACTLAGVLVGAGYEALQDFRNEGQSDPWDAVATTAGASMMGALIQWLVPIFM